MYLGSLQRLIRGDSYTRTAAECCLLFLVARQGCFTPQSIHPDGAPGSPATTTSTAMPFCLQSHY